jgi:arylsulfate sulfotransferase
MTTDKALVLGCLFVSPFVYSGCSSSNSSNQPVSVAVTPQTGYVGSAQTLQLTATVMNDTSGVIWSVAGTGGGAVDAQGNFTAPTVTQNATATVTATSVKDSTKSASATITIIAPGVVTGCATAGVCGTAANPQVAQYAITVPDGLSVFIQFSTDTSYNLKTWSVEAPSGGGSVPILVAGMKGNTQYHLQAVFQQTGTTTTVFTDSDHPFTTSAYPAATLPSLTVTTATGQTPQSGVELLDLLATAGPGRTQLHAVVTDLSGNVLWAYDPGSSVPAGTFVNPIKMLSNGHFLIIYSGVNPDGQNSVVQEVDLAGNVVWSMTSQQLNTALAAATCAGCNITVIGVHHDFAELPNGHIVFLGATERVVSGTSVVGDVVIDLDQNHDPVWLWNSFDHLDITRHPIQFPDWTHSNALVYSPDDKSLMVSIRHQHWVIKINYNDGAGDGSIIWKLGHQGDFALQSGTTNAVDPVDWFYAQHDAHIISTNTSGAIDVLLFDNGNQRILQASPEVVCPTNTPCESRVPIIHVDETAKTAEITWIDKLAPPFSFFGGSARLMANGNVEFCESASTTPPAVNAAIFEVTKTTPPQVVWQMQIAGQNAYRGFRIPSLYPGVQW